MLLLHRINAICVSSNIKSTSKYIDGGLMTDVRSLEDEQRQENLVLKSWCNIWKTSPNVQIISCATAAASYADNDDNMANKDDDAYWYHAKNKFWFDSTCQFTYDLKTMNCTTYGSTRQSRPSLMETTCSVEALTAGYSAAEACSCDALNTFVVSNPKCWQDNGCDHNDDHGSSMELCDGCGMYSTCQCSFIHNISNNEYGTVEYNGIPWTDNFMDLLQQAMKNGKDLFELAEYIDSNQPSIQGESITWNVEARRCKSIAGSGFSSLLSGITIGLIIVAVGAVAAIASRWLQLRNEQRDRKATALVNEMESSEGGRIESRGGHLALIMEIS